MVALLGGVPSGKGRLPDGIVKRAGTPGPRWPSPHFLGSAAALRARRPQKRPAAPRLPYRGRAPRLPSRCSFSAGAPRAAAARQLPPRGTRDRQLGSWFGLGLVTGTAHGTGEGSRWGRGRGARSTRAQLSRAQTRVLWLVRRSQASATSSAGGMLFLVRLEGMHRRARGQEEGEGLGTSHPGTDTSQSRALLCRSGAPRAGGRLQSRPGPQPGRRCHPSCFCFSAGRCLGSSGVRMRT